MTVTREEMAAFLDGELSGEQAREAEAAIAADPELQRQVQRHRALKSKLSSHFDPILDEPLPAALRDMLPARAQETASVVSIAEARERNAEKRRLPRWSWIAGPALAASLALVVLAPREDGSEGYADARLAGVLDQRLVAEQAPGDSTRVLLSFRNREGEFCRAFSGSAASGIACRDDAGWKLEALGEGGAGAGTDYRMAGAGDAQILARAQAMAQGSALDADQERAARDRDWR